MVVRRNGTAVGRDQPAPRWGWFAAFAVVAIGWTWAALGVAWLSGAAADEAPTVWLRLVAGVGPLVGAFVLLRRDPAVPDQAAFWRRVVTIRAVGARWWIVVVVASGGPGAVVWLFGRREFDAASSGAIAAVVAFAVAASVAEEPGWRGYGLDQLRNRPWAAVMVIAACWMVWHLPLYAIDGTFQHDEVGMGTTFFWLLQAALVPQTMLMIWILGRTGWTISTAVVFHALVNVSGEVFAYTTHQQAARLGLWVVLALCTFVPVAVRSPVDRR